MLLAGRAATALLSLSLSGSRGPQNATLEGTVRALDVRVAGAVAYLRSAMDTSYSPSSEPLVIDQVNLRFVPAVLVVVPGTTLEFRNSDPLRHNVFSPKGPGAGFDLGTYPRNDRRRHSFTQLGAHVILCHVHPEMAAYVVVVPTPYHAVVDAEGRFRIENVPAGRYTLHIWHRRLAPLERTVTLRSGTTVRLELELGRG